MASFSTPAILLRRVEFGDYDLIVSLFTLNEGKVSLIAKAAKKSLKRFSGVLELFSILQVVWSKGMRKGLPVLQEASLEKPFFNIRTDFKKAAYASYWAELINTWLEDGVEQKDLYYLLEDVLSELDHGLIDETVLSILFQTRFISMSGFSPDFTQCSVCRVDLEKIKDSRVAFDIKKGGLICRCCDSERNRRILLSKGTVKQLLWAEKEKFERAKRIRFTPQTLQEALRVLEEFVPYHLGKKPKSLKFLNQIRRDGNM